MSWFRRKTSGSLLITDMPEKHLCIRCWGYANGYCAINSRKVTDYTDGSYTWSPTPTVPCRDRNMGGCCPDYSMSVEEALYKLDRKMRGV
jgi:hypothetical protein